MFVRRWPEVAELDDMLVELVDTITDFAFAVYLLALGAESTAQIPGWKVFFGSLVTTCAPVSPAGNSTYLALGQAAAVFLALNLVTRVGVEYAHYLRTSNLRLGESRTAALANRPLSFLKIGLAALIHPRSAEVYGQNEIEVLKRGEPDEPDAVAKWKKMRRSYRIARDLLQLMTELLPAFAIQMIFQAVGGGISTLFVITTVFTSIDLFTVSHALYVDITSHDDNELIELVDQINWLYPFFLELFNVLTDFAFASLLILIGKPVGTQAGSVLAVLGKFISGACTPTQGLANTYLGNLGVASLVFVLVNLIAKFGVLFWAVRSIAGERSVPLCFWLFIFVFGIVNVNSGARVADAYFGTLDEMQVRNKIQWLGSSTTLALETVPQLVIQILFYESTRSITILWALAVATTGLVLLPGLYEWFGCLYGYLFLPDHNNPWDKQREMFALFAKSRGDKTSVAAQRA